MLFRSRPFRLSTYSAGGTSSQPPFESQLRMSQQERSLAEREARLKEAEDRAERDAEEARLAREEAKREREEASREYQEFMAQLRREKEEYEERHR